MQHSISEIGRHYVIKIEDRIDAFNCSDFRKTVFQYINGDRKSIVLDMEHVGFTDTSAISALISCKQEADRHDVQFALVNTTESFIEILRLATINNFFTIYSGLDSLPV